MPRYEREVQNCVFGSQWGYRHSRENGNPPFGTLDSRFRGSDWVRRVEFYTCLRCDYRYLECDRTFEATHSMGAGPVKACVLCGAESVQKLISPPMINTIKSSSPTGARYEKMSRKEIIDMEAEPLVTMEQQEGMAEKLAFMYGGKLD